MTLYDNIRKRREQLNITQQELAERMGYTSRSTISKIENGENDIPQSKIIAFAKALNTTPAYLMGWTEEHQSIQYPSNIMPLPAMKEWPVLGATACGKPLHREMLDETVLAPVDIKADIVFRCVGDSMINARIFDGDAVFIHLQPEVENGQIAVIRIGDEYTLKRVYVFDHYVELRSENPTVKPIILRGPELEPDSFEVVGLAVAFMSAIL